MPGILGFAGIAGRDCAEPLMKAMVESMCAGDSFAVDVYIGAAAETAAAGKSAEVGLGRVHLNLIDPQPQPLWSADRSVALVMTGEIFSWEGLSFEQPLSGSAQGFSNAELVLQAYLQHGEAFPGYLNGNFAAAIWDANTETLLLVSDPLTSYPLYYTQVGDALVFGSAARAVAEAPGLTRALDTAALTEMVAFEHIYGDKTLFAGVRLLLPGTVLRFRAGALVTSSYIDFQYPEYYDIKEEGYYVDAWIHYMRQAVLRQARGPAPLGVMLTGGLDSRTILGMLAGQGMDLRTLTWGVPGCDDEAAASELAGILHVPHRFLPLQPDFLAQLGAKAVRITDGQKSITHLHMMGILGDIAQEAKVIYKGFLGGTIHGYVVFHNRLAPVREDVWFEHVFATRNRIFGEQDFAQLFTDPFYRQVRDVPRQSLRESLARSHSAWWVDKDSYIDLYEEDVRFTIMGVEQARSQLHVRTPLADNDLLRFTMSVPPGFRVDKHYYRQAIIKAFPQLAKVVYTGTRRPLAESSFRNLRMQLDEQARWWLRNRGMNWVPVTTARPYADYGGWMRRELRPWVEGVLLSPQALDRGIFQPAYVRRLVADHMNGCDHTRQISMLLTLELWHREFLD
jgi:asparagine synthase (glutamine-hydrolysing)